MPLSRFQFVRFAPAITALLMAASGAYADPTTAPAARTNDQIVASLQSTDQQLSDLVGDSSALADATKRQAMVPKALPLVHQMLNDYADLIALRPGIKANLASVQLQLLALASALGEQQSTDQIKSMLASTDPAEAIRGQIGDLLTQWTLAGTQPEAQSKVVDAFQKVAEAHTDSVPLTMFAAQLTQSATTPDVKARLNKLLTETMKNPAVAQIKMQMDMDAAAQRMKDAVNKPFTVAGTTIDGVAFTTAHWKGKVVLVDFWATWCGPCRAELPHLQQLYSDNHEKGLEVVGVSNDYSADKLKTFTAEQHMPWPQLFDAAAAGDQQWNPITLGYGINGIPTMYLIDKKGVLRSVEAREEVDTLLPRLLAE